MKAPVKYRFFRHIVNLGLLVLIGTVGFMVIEKWRFLDALFMTVHTLATVGYGEVHPLSDAGKLFAILLIFSGVGVFLYILSGLAETFIDVNPTALLGRRRMKKHIEKLEGHQIVCGFGRTGQEVANHFKYNQIPFVIVEENAALAKTAEESGFLVICGDASSDDILVEAGVKKAKGIVCALPDDASNTFISLSAKGFNEEITIVSRAANPGSDSKLRRAGAKMVISPYVICGRRMATAVTHPLVMEFLDVAMHTPGHDLRLEQRTITGESSLVGQTLKDANIRQKSGAMILAVSQGGVLVTNPAPETVFKEGDILIALGADEELQKLAKLSANS